MWKTFSAGLSDANKWGQTATPAGAGQAVRDIAFALTKLLFALTYFLIGVAFLMVGSVEDVVTKGRDTVGEKRGRKLKSHLDWDRPEDARSNPALRR